jgi:FtsP/CotA-like multicopper oxidase with cupredoxin domain
MRTTQYVFPLAFCLAAITSAGGVTHAARGESLAPAEWDAGVRLTEATDVNPDPAVVEVNLTARVASVEVAEGKRVTAWTYDGGLPGPLVRAHVGNRLIVHFTNTLPQPTTVHWHGVRVPIEMDGVPEISQPEVKTGESFTYDFVVRDAGLFWYHPHVMSAAQVGFGLYGALFVDHPDDGVGITDELTLVLSDIGFDKRGVLDAADSGGSAGMVFGREGSYLLVNGRVQPRVRARAGAPQRWRIVNAAKSRFFLLDMDGQPFVKIGSDGGLQERPEASDVLLVTPGERVDVIVAPTGRPGTSLTVRAMLYNRGYGSVEYRNAEDLLTIDFDERPRLPAPKPPSVRRTLMPPPMDAAKRVDVVLTRETRARSIASPNTDEPGSRTASRPLMT